MIYERYYCDNAPAADQRYEIHCDAPAADQRYEIHRNHLSILSMASLASYVLAGAALGLMILDRNIRQGCKTAVQRGVHQEQAWGALHLNPPGGIERTHPEARWVTCNIWER